MPSLLFLSHISNLLAVNENPINPLLSDPAFSISFAQFIMYMYMYIRQGQATLEAPPQSWWHHIRAFSLSMHVCRVCMHVLGRQQTARWKLCIHI